MELFMYDDPDLEICTEIYADAFTAPPLNYGFITKENARRYIESITKTPGFLGYTCRVEGETIAFVFGLLDNYFEGMMFEIAELGVASAFQRRGFGSKIMGILEAKLAGYGVSAVNLQTSRNLPAFEFYLKNGYEEVTENVTLMKWL